MLKYKKEKNIMINQNKLQLYLEWVPIIHLND